MNKVTLYALSALGSLGGLSVFICWRHELSMAAIGVAIISGVIYAAIGTRAALHFNVNGLPQPPNVVPRTILWLLGIGVVLGFGIGALLVHIF